MDNYITLYDRELDKIQKAANKLVLAGYIPSGGITVVTHYGLFHNKYF